MQVGDFGGTGLVTQTAGTVNITGSFNIGNQGGAGTYDLQNGTVNLLTGLYDIGRNSGNNAAGSGTLKLEGGLFDIKSSNFILGNRDTNSGTLGQSSGKVIQTGGTMLVEGTSAIFLSARGNGEYDLDGGTLEIGGTGLRSNYNGSGGTGALHMGGGTLAVTGANLTTDATVVLDAGSSSALSLGALNATFSSGIAGAGNLEVSGTGTAAFSTLGGTGTVTIDAGSTVSVAGAVGADETIAFNGAGGTLALGSPGTFAGTITGFDAGDRIDLTTLAFIDGGTAVLDGATDILTITDGTRTYTQQLAGNYTGDFFHLIDDGHGGSYVTEDQVPCFCRGTRILTAKGEVAVEDLRVGDKVVTIAGEEKPIAWIGSGRRVLTGKNPEARPLIVRADALADGVPLRDLYLTRGHSLYLDGVLIPVEFLVNERSILWDEAATEVEFYHLELEEHAVLLAEGAPAESYRDDGNRLLFDNPEPPRFAAANMESFAPVLTGGPEVDRIWLEILDRAGFEATEATDDPDLHLVADGERIEAHAVDCRMHGFQGI
ncbi:MAG: hypothetical protein JWM91_2280, partial [Rhodospirillales bacterium]|nr:hypothetical protein [Rhodospirillales bacterium]